MFYWEYTVIKTTVWENQFWNKTEVPVIFIILCYIKSILAQASTFTLRKTFLFKYTENFTTTTKKEKNQIKYSDIFLISTQNIYWGGYNEYPQSMFMSRNKKKQCIPL